MSLSASQSELTTPEAFTEPTLTEKKQKQRLTDKASQGRRAALGEGSTAVFEETMSSGKMNRAEQCREFG